MYSLQHIVSTILKDEFLFRKKTYKMFKTLDSFNPAFSADSVEWCPAEGLHDYFVCGTYELMENQEQPRDSKRLGKIYLFKTQNFGKLNAVQELETSGVLDIKWAPQKYNEEILLGVANARGYLEIFQLTSHPVSLIFKWKVCVQPDCLALSLDWLTLTETELLVAVSDSKGFVSVYEIAQNTIQERFKSTQAHGFEAWIVGFDYSNVNVLYSGGDDCKFHRYDIRQNNAPNFTNKIHGAGVTSLHSNSKREHLLCTGSYDEVVRTWDTRQLKTTLGEKSIDGGIWRLKWEPLRKRHLLAACMYNGFQIIDCESADNLSVFATYNQHQSIAYGCDWSSLTADQIKAMQIGCENEHHTLVATCSFYDRLLNLSAVQINSN